MTHYHATINVPGYLPVADEPTAFRAASDAWDHLCEERTRDDRVDDDDEALHSMEEQGDHEGVVYGPTPGCEGDHDLGLAYSVTACDNEDCEVSE